MSIQLSLHARSEPGADWQAQLAALQALREREAAQAAILQHAAALQAAGAAAGAGAPCNAAAARGLVPAAARQRQCS